MSDAVAVAGVAALPDAADAGGTGPAAIALPPTISVDLTALVDAQLSIAV